jgi:hypothetical protein
MDNRPRSISSPPTRDATDALTDGRAREILSEIERTRDDMSETVDAIQEKLRPANVVANAASATTEKVKDMASSAAETAREWWDASGGGSAMARVRNNPLPALLAGVGLTWLAFSKRGTTPRYRSASVASAGSGNGEGMSTASAAMAASQQGIANARRVVRQSQNRVESMVREYPLAVAAAAAILGASLGMAVPETERENELMGEARDNALQRAQQTASGAVDRVKEAAADVVNRAGIGD